MLEGIIPLAFRIGGGARPPRLPSWCSLWMEWFKVKWTNMPPMGQSLTSMPKMAKHAIAHSVHKEFLGEWPSLAILY